MLSVVVIRISSMRVATRSGLARFWLLSDIDEASGNSQWACSALDLCGYRRREWQPAVGLLTSCTHADISDASGNSQWVCSVFGSCGYREREWQLALGLLCFWTHANTDDASGNSQWACSAWVGPARIQTSISDKNLYLDCRACAVFAFCGAHKFRSLHV